MDSLNSERVVAHAAQQLTTYTNGLCNNVDVQYWWKVVDVVWDELTLVRGVAKDLPASFVMPTSLMATDRFMLDPAMVHKTKEWPKWDVIRNSKDEDFVDHPWYKIRDQGPEGRVHDKGKGREVPAVIAREPKDLFPHWMMPVVPGVPGQIGHALSRAAELAGRATVPRQGVVSVAVAVVVAVPDLGHHNAIEVTSGTKQSANAWPIYGCYTKSTKGIQEDPAMTYVEHLVQVEEEIFIVRREHAALLTQLANQREQIDSLTLIVEELWKVVANLSPMTPAPGLQDALSFPTQPTPLALASTTVLEEVGTSATTSRLPSPAPPPPIDAAPPVTSAIPETCWDLVLASWMLAISITPPVDSPDMETQLEGDGMHVD
ncbi:hypothetical protein SCLCIDRAFT_19901 [Scleroderma citrinum Foug A]|uniref:Uncharacterized protein n=1 Tax=Scleroderma citrinum Foug A TaxID=1036808 RepID=A0A0C3EM64_9AGAM|nr:hypothetical protein SCLCIDRAFT_19901 [Scleroderma citrinum Foug A]